MRLGSGAVLISLFVICSSIPLEFCVGPHNSQPTNGVASLSTTRAWDPLVGAPALGVPRYHVTTGYLSSTQRPEYLGGQPVWLAYDPADGSFWIAALPNYVEAVPASAIDSTPTMVAVGSQPFGVAVDNVSNSIFVTNTGSDNVTVVSGISNRPVGTIGVGVRPEGVAYDPADRELFVANSGSANVTVISTQTLRVVANVAVGLGPTGVAYDAATSQVFVADHDSYDVRAISTTSNSVVATIAAGIGPYGVAVDTASEDVYVTNEGSRNVTVIDSSTYAIVSNIPLVGPSSGWPIDPQGLAFNSRTGQIWVGAGEFYLVVLNTSSETVQAVYSTDPSGVAFDPDLGVTCLTNSYNSTFQCFSPASRPSNTLRATFTESGLPAGVRWSVEQQDGPGVETSASSITIWIANVVMWKYCDFVVPPTTGYQASSPKLSVNLSGGDQNLWVTFAPGPPQYPVYINETGLYSSTGWSVDLNGTVRESTSRSIIYYLTNGTTTFTTGRVEGYSASPSSGSFTIAPHSRAALVGFSLFTYRLDFFTAQLPSTASWYVDITAGPQGFPVPQSSWSVAPDISFQLPNGSYSYQAGFSNGGFFTLSERPVDFFGGLPTSVLVTFVQNQSGGNAGVFGLLPGSTYAWVAIGFLGGVCVSVLSFAAIRWLRRRQNSGLTRTRP